MHLTDLLTRVKAPLSNVTEPSYLGELTFDGVEHHLYSDGTLLPVVAGGSTDTHPNQADKRLLTVDEFCKRYSVARSHAFKLLRNGEIDSVLAGGPRQRRIPVDAAERWLAKLNRADAK